MDGGIFFGGGGNGGGGAGVQQQNRQNNAAGQNPLEQWFYEMPVVTRWWTTATVVISLLVHCDVLSPLQLFYSFNSVFVKYQFWRLLTTFLFFGNLTLDLLFHVFFLQRYSRLLEESSGRSPAHFSWLLVFATITLLVLSPFIGMPFLGGALSSTFVYIWARRNPDTRLSFLGLLVFTAPYLPWVLMGFSLFLHSTIPKDELCGVAVGHVWYFFNDVYPPLHNGHKPFDPPNWWVRLFESRDQEVDQPEEEELQDDTGAGGLERDIAAGAPAQGIIG